MIVGSPNEFSKREEALRFSLEVLKAQPELLGNKTDGGEAAAFITDMADSFIKYIMTKDSPPAK